MKLSRYPDYKDSGVDWLGPVPRHWGVRRLKTLVSQLTEKATERRRPVGLENIEGWSGRFISTDADFQGEGVAFNAGDILFGKLRPYLAKVYLADVCGEAVGDFHVFRPLHEVEGRYLQYAMLSRQFIDIVDGSTFGSKMPRASWESLGGMPVVVPPPEEQHFIAAFLDRETAKIDALIAEQERLLELLAEKRQAVISHAVTKGLNPDAQMKDSGVAWLGTVPSHWCISRVKDVCSTTSGGTPNTALQGLYYTDGAGIPWVRTTDLSNDLLTSVEVHITEQALKDTACSVLPPGTVMIAMYGGDGTVGKNGLLGIPAAINQAICGLLPSEAVIPDFIFRFMQFQRPHWMVVAESSRKDPNISQERVRNAAITVPPKDEQVAIAQAIERACAKIDRLEQQANNAVKLLQERRSALIAAAVTGQIDVREPA